MAKSKAVRGTGHPHEDDPFILQKKQDLTIAERQELRKFFESPTWHKVLSNARLCRPSIAATPADAKNPESVRQANNDRLCQIQGWKMLEVALGREVMPPEERRPAPQDSYPDAGRIGADAQQSTKP